MSGRVSGAAFALLAFGAALAGAEDVRGGSRSWCGTYGGNGRDALWAHREHAQREGRDGLAAVRAAEARSSYDVGNVAVVLDEGDLFLPANPVDLRSIGVEFSPEGAGYRVTRVDRPVGAPGPQRLSLTDDSSTSVTLPFEFPYYGRRHTQVFVNSDGNLTFEEAEFASTARSLGRFLGGPPRIGALFADLDPEVGGSVSLDATAERAIFTWFEVPQFGQRDKNTFQMTLWATGRIDFAYGSNVSGGIREAVAGIAPGRDQGGLLAVDMSNASGAGEGAIAEGFRLDREFDIVAVGRKFYRTHGDDYQQVIVFTNRPVGGLANGYFAFESNVKNEDEGIGLGIFDGSREFGSAGRLESFVLMESIGKYGTDLTAPILDGVSALSVLGQEVGHRWGAFARFMDGGVSSSEFLGRDNAHWSYYLDSDGSHLEGNEIADEGGGRFRTGTGGARFSPLDQYLMGLRPADEVPPFFLVRNPTPPKDKSSGPLAGQVFTGTRKDITIGDVVAALGPRRPAAGTRDPWRQAFVFVSVGGAADPALVERVERFRAAWEPFFAQSVDGRGAVDTRLQ